MSDLGFYLQIQELQPSQLFLSELKIKRNEQWLTNKEVTYEAIPIIELDGKVVMTDGHTRTYILSKLGVKEIKVAWDLDALDLVAYREYLNWCEIAGIQTVNDLEHRILSAEEYEVLWIGKCQSWQNELEYKSENP